MKLVKRKTLGRRVQSLPRFLSVMFLFVAGIFFILVPARGDSVPHEHAILRVLDKVAGATELLVVPIGKAVEFRSIHLLVLACYRQPPERTPESAAWIEVYKDGDNLFKGWMFASSPALSSMEHPVYDVWLVDCGKNDKSADDN